MRVLLDECVPRPLRRELPEHEVRTVQEVGWAGTLNGELLRRINKSDFDVFVTTDQRLEYQQNLEAKGVAVIVLVAVSNKLRALLPLVPELRRVLGGIRPGEAVRIGG